MNLIVTDLASRETTSINSCAAHDIEFVIGDCALGKVLVARSPIGVCAIRFGSTPGRWSRIWPQASRTAGLS
jgi:hypothetical protein